MWDIDTATRDLIEKKLEVQLVRVLLDNNLFPKNGLSLPEGAHPEANFVWCFGVGPFGLRKDFAYGLTAEAAHSNWRWRYDPKVWF